MKPASSGLDLATINEVQAVVVRSLRDQVCQWEQDALDAGKRGDYLGAQTCKQWAFAADILATKASSVCTSLFLDALDSLKVVTDQRTVELPSLRSDEDRHLDDLTVEVLSHQPEHA